MSGGLWPWHNFQLWKSNTKVQGNGAGVYRTNRNRVEMQRITRRPTLVLVSFSGQLIKKTERNAIIILMVSSKSMTAIKQIMVSNLAVDQMRVHVEFMYELQTTLDPLFHSTLIVSLESCSLSYDMFVHRFSSGPPWPSNG